MRILKAFYILVLMISALAPARPAGAAEEPRLAAQTASAAPSALCLPGVYTYNPGDCLAQGPSAYQLRMAEAGMHLPLTPLTGYTPIDPALGSVNVSYAEVRNKPAGVFASVEDARKGGKKGAVNKLNGNFLFVSYTNEAEMDGKKFYEIEAGQWMTGNDLIRLGIVPASRGITFQATPTISFGWALTYFTQNGVLEVKRTPGLANQDYTGRTLNLYDILPIYGQQDVDGETWYMLGPDEWVPAKHFARVRPNPIPPAGISGDRWIEVNLFDQSLAVYDNGQMVYATIIASGAEPFWTRPGVFQISKKFETTPMQGAMGGDGSDAYYLEDVPWTMYFDGARALHGAYWRAKMGFPQSHGCVNLTVGDAHWLYNWATEGDWVYVWDPSGKTPTDEALYSSGGF